MKKLLFGSVAIAALIAANAASAADMGLPVKGRALEAEWNWSGFYAGLNAGYARSTTVWNDLDATLTAGGTFINQSTSGFIGGGQIGYNWQVRHAVFGVETDFNYLGLNHATNLFVLTGGTPTAIHDSLRWIGTVRGRAGLAVDNVLMYLTAGLAYGRTDHKEIDGAPILNADLSATKVGFAAGVGTEYGVDPHWSVKAEALYVDLGKSSTTIGPFFGGLRGRFDTLDTMWIVRAGVNYKFGG